MKKWIIVLSAVAIVFSIIIVGLTSAASVNLRATWSQNQENDMKEYRLYRTDGARTLLGTIPHPTTIYNFTVTVPDNSQGSLTFVLTAVDLSGNESLDSLPASFGYNTDVISPATPKDLSVKKQ